MTENTALEYAYAERDVYKLRAEEMQKAILKLPKPPHEMGDGPDERVGHILSLIRPLPKMCPDCGYRCYAPVVIFNETGCDHCKALAQQRAEIREA